MRKSIDKVVIALLLCLAFAFALYFAIFAFITAMAEDSGSKKENGTEEQSVELPYTAIEDNPLAAYAIECDMDFASFEKKVTADERYTEGFGLDVALMYNTEHDIVVGSLNYLWSQISSDSTYYEALTGSDEFKEAIPATRVILNFDEKLYNVYYSGVLKSQITDFLRLYDYEQDEENAGKIFRIEEVYDGIQEYENHELSTGIKVKKTTPLSLPFSMKNYTFEYSYTLK